MRKKQIIIFIVLIAFVTLIIFGVQRGAKLPSSEGLAVENTIIASDQLAGKMVSVDTVELVVGGFIVIHEDNFGFPIDILGVSDYIESGVYHNFPVSLQEKSSIGDKMFAVIHEDNGDRLFDPEFDFSVMDENKKNVMSAFIIE